MKRSPLKRTSSLARGKPLTADPKKAQEFIARGRSALSRSAGPSSRGGGMRRASAAEGPLSPEAWREAVYRQAGGRCMVTNARASNADDPTFDAHHVVPKRVLRARGLLDRVFEARNGVWLRADIHAAVENPGVRARPLTAEMLPAAVWEFASELDALEGTYWATELVLRAHPRRADPGTQ